jgi:hypothetical protein
MKDLRGLGEDIVLLLFGILHRVTRVIMKFVRRRKKLLLKSSEVRMGSEDVEKRPILHLASLLYM